MPTSAPTLTVASNLINADLLNFADTHASPVPMPGVPKMVRITPDVARAMLDRSHATGFQNRQVRASNVTQIAAEMTTGQFKATTQGISVAYDGAVTDGQHRLEAIIKSGVTVDILVWFNVPKDYFDKMDSVGAARTGSDWVGVMGISEKNRAPISQAYTLLSKYARRAKNDDGKALTPTDLGKIHAQYPALVDVAADGVEMAKNIGCRPQAAILTLFLAKNYVFATGKDYDEFLRGISHGYGLDETDPRAHVRHKFTKEKNHKKADGRRTLSRPWDHLSWLLTALDDYSQGRTYATARGKYQAGKAFPHFMPAPTTANHTLTLAA